MKHFYVVFSFQNTSSSIGKGSIVIEYDHDIKSYFDIIKIKEIISEEGYKNAVVEHWTEIEPDPYYVKTSEHIF